MREARGLYRDPGAWEDPLYTFQFRYPKLVFSHETALFLLGLSEREPVAVSATLATGTGSAALAHDGVRVYKVRSGLFELGLGAAETPLQPRADPRGLPAQPDDGRPAGAARRP